MAPTAARRSGLVSWSSGTACVATWRLGLTCVASFLGATVVMLVAGEENLREVTMFPMNQQAQDLMMNAPNEASARQLKELHIRTVLPETK